MKLTFQGARWGSSRCFDHDPADSELTCLLDAPRCLGMSNFRIVEAGGILRVVPEQWPTTWIVATTLPVAVLFTAVPIFLEFGSSSGSSLFDMLFAVFLWAWFAFIWLVLMPLVAVVPIVVNHYKRKADDFLRVDMTRRVLELCRADRTLRSTEILAFTEVSRFLRLDRRGGEWLGNLQTGVLVRTANGGTELLALADGMRRQRLADRLASVFQVPVRRIKLSKSESRALNDC